MFIVNASVRRPVAICCVIIGLALLGFNAYRKFGLEFLPKMDLPFVTVVTVYPGATPSDIETDVAKKVEDVVTEVDGLKHVTSSCMDNVCQTILEFKLGTDVDVAAMDVREKLDTIMSQLPPGIDRPVVLKYNLNAKPVVTMALTGDADLNELYDYADNTLRDRLSVISGVANVELLGGSKREVHVLLDRTALASAGLASMHVVQAVQNGIFTLPSGRIREQGSEYGVRFDAEYSSVREIGDLQVAGRDGIRRYVRDLGTVAMSAEERRQAAFIDGRPCIGLRVVKKADANAVSVVEEVRRTVDGMRSGLPGGMELKWVADDGAFIKSAADRATRCVLEGIALTALVLFLFLYNIRATVIVGISMPLTIVISLFFMHAMGLTLNQSTLLALALSVGILVMDCIVVLESILSHLKRHDSPWDAARVGTAEVAVAIIGIAAAHVVVLLPIGMMGSMVGLFFKPFAWTVLIVNVVSFFVAVTLTPVLCALLLKKTDDSEGLLSRLARRWDAGLERVAGSFVGALRAVAGSRWLSAGVLAAVLAVFVHALTLAPKVGFGFMPQMDRGEAFVKLEYPTRQDLAQTVARVREVEARLRTIPSVRTVFTQIGKVEGVLGKSSEGVYLAQLLVEFPDKTERAAGIQDLLTQIRGALRDHTDCIVNVSIPAPIGGEEIPIEMEIAGENLPELEGTALAIQDVLNGEMPGFTGVDTSVRAGKPELRILPNRPILADLSAPVQGLGLMARANLEGMKAGIYRSGVRTYDIRVKLAEVPGKAQLDEFQVPAGEDRSVTLNSLARVVPGESPVQITRVDKSRVSKVYSSLSPDLPMGTAMAQIDEAIARKGLMPPGCEYKFRGLSEHMTEATASFLEAGILAVFLIYLTLAAILESFRKPFLILVTIPFGLIGVLWALYATGQSMSMFVLLGMVLLVGVVVNNAILILDRMQLLRDQGVEPREAMLQAVKIEFRAVLMVTLSAILGMLPLAVATGLGSEMSAAMGISSVGGIAASALLTLMVMPLVYLLFIRKAKAPLAGGGA